MAGTGSMDMGTGMMSIGKTCIGTRTRDTHIRLPAGFTHTGVEHYPFILKTIESESSNMKVRYKKSLNKKGNLIKRIKNWSTGVAALYS
jgi:hypothetical protein